MERAMAAMHAMVSETADREAEKLVPAMLTGTTMIMGQVTVSKTIAETIAVSPKTVMCVMFGKCFAMLAMFATSAMIAVGVMFATAAMIVMVAIVVMVVGVAVADLAMSVMFETSAMEKDKKRVIDAEKVTEAEKVKEADRREESRHVHYWTSETGTRWMKRLLTLCVAHEMM